MSSRPPGWPTQWDWFDADEVLKNLQQTPNDKILTELVQNIIFLQRESANFIYEYLGDDKDGSRPAAYKDILFGFNDVQMTGWSASCGAAETPARYAIALSGATFLQHYITLNRILSVPTVLPGETSQQLPSAKKVQFVQIVSGGFDYRFEGSPTATESIAGNERRVALERQLLVYCVFFLFLHELSHIEGGHLDYKAERMKERKYWPIRQIRETRALESRTMEYLADSHAILRGTDMVAASLSIERSRSVILHLQQFGVAVGLNLLLTDMAANPEAIDEPDWKDHPSGGSRLIWCAYLVSEEGHFKKIWPSKIAGGTPSKDARKAVIGLHPVPKTPS